MGWTLIASVNTLTNNIWVFSRGFSLWCGKPVTASKVVRPTTQRQRRLCVNKHFRIFCFNEGETKTHKIVFLMETPTSNSPILLIRKVYNLARGYVCLKDLTLYQNLDSKTHTHPHYIYKLQMTPTFTKVRWRAALVPPHSKTRHIEQDLRKHISTSLG